MFAVLRRNPVALGLAILLHIALAVFLVLEVDWRDKIKPIGADVAVVQATLVDQQELDAADNRKKAAEREQVAAAQRAEQEKLNKRRAEEKRKQAEEKKRVEAEKVRLAEQKKRKEEEKKQAEEKNRKAELEKKRELEEKQRKEEEVARKQAAAEAEAKKQAEEKKKAEAEAERKRRAEAEKKAEAERKRKAAAKARADREAELAAQYEAEQDASELQRTVALIQEKIERNWLRPQGTEGLKCELSVRLGTSGSVLLVRVVKSSGNIAFDRSVEAAVLKADPLPMPRSERLLARFRGDVTLIFDPSN